MKREIQRRTKLDSKFSSLRAARSVSAHDLIDFVYKHEVSSLSALDTLGNWTSRSVIKILTFSLFMSPPRVSKSVTARILRNSSRFLPLASVIIQIRNFFFWYSATTPFFRSLRYERAAEKKASIRGLVRVVKFGTSLCFYGFVVIFFCC